MSAHRPSSSDLIDFYGLNCPEGGQFYICTTAWTSFMGCCTSDPCRYGYGVCLEEDLRPASFKPVTGVDFLPQGCPGEEETHFWYSCPGNDSAFIGCCEENPCVEGTCSAESLMPARLSTVAGRQVYLFDVVANATGSATNTDAGTTPNPTSYFENTIGERVDSSSLSYDLVVGITVAAMVVAMSCFSGLFSWLFAALEKRRGARCPRAQYGPILQDIQAALEAGERQGERRSTDTGGSIEKRPYELKETSIGRSFSWAWDVLLTLTPIPFVVLASLALRLEDESPSSYGEKLIEITRVAPTLYPIMFAAILSRFYKNVARWYLEQPDGAKLAKLEQLFGSQNSAGALERLLFVRADVSLGFLILCTWALSPLGGQSASRILSIGESRHSTTDSIYYSHSSYQFSYAFVSSLADSVRSNVYALYTSSLMASAYERRSATDIWGFPKIPQWPRGQSLNGSYEVDQSALSLGMHDYASLLGTKLRGLACAGGEARYDFSVESSYVDFDCSRISYEVVGGFAAGVQWQFEEQFRNTTSVYIIPLLNTTHPSHSSFIADFYSSTPWAEWQTAEETPSLYMVYSSLKTSSKADQGYAPETLYLFNCTMQTVVLETDLHCPAPSNCSSLRQRRVQVPSKQLPDMTLDHVRAFRHELALWPRAGGQVDMSRASATENFIAGDEYSYGGQQRREWSEVDVLDFSRRLTTTFNTFYDATLDPLGRFSANSTLRGVPENKQVVENALDMHESFNATQALVRRNNVYRANWTWVGFLLTTTIILQLLALVGIILQFFIRGPDVLGFVSSLTRDNRYADVPLGGSMLDGPDRSRMLRNVRVQLGDVRPGEEKGYIALRTIRTEGTMKKPPEQGHGRAFVRPFGEGQRKPDRLIIRTREEVDGAANLHGWRRLDKRRHYV